MESRFVDIDTEIVKLNGLKSNILKSGQVLRIPEK